MRSARRDNSAVSLGPLSWARLDASDSDVEHDLKFILGEQDFTSLCGTQWPDRGSREFTMRANASAPPSCYYRGRDDDGNCVTVCVVRDVILAH